MRSRITVGTLLVVGLLGVGTLASRATEISGPRHWTLVHFMNPVTVQGRVVMGPVLIVHDDEKMAKGEACTTFYRFDPSRGPREEIVSFHCKPAERALADVTTFTTLDTQDTACKKLVEYQIAGETEAHGIPAK